MLLTNLATLMLSGFVGYAVISKVPNTLHTPLMSGTNAIHGIVVLGGIVLLATGAAGDSLTKGLLTVAVAFGTINVVGGFLVTDRMLEMFKSKPKAPGAEEGGGARAAGSPAAHGGAPQAGDGGAPASGGGAAHGDGAHADGGDGGS